MNTTSVLRLDFGAECSFISESKSLRDGLSVVIQIGNTLWVTNDETVSLERLTLVEDRKTGTYGSAGHHRQFLLQDYLDLPAPAAPDGKDMAEADVEGLAYQDGYLWLVGSHSLKRKKPRPKDDPDKALKRLGTIARDPNRYLLARIPVLAEGESHTLARTDDRHKRSAAILHGDGKGNDLTDALAQDEHLAPFLGIPGKDNGFDIEGLAVAGSRIFLGLRGPVLRGYALILELEPREDEADASRLRLNPLQPGGLPYRKHCLDLAGLGVRDLCPHGDDLLILAGPTMDLDGPVAVFRWTGWASRAGDSLVPASQLERILEVPYGHGTDHAEGMALFSPDGGEPSRLLVVYDAAAENRHMGQCSVMADIFPLPPKRP